MRIKNIDESYLGVLFYLEENHNNGLIDKKVHVINGYYRVLFTGDVRIFVRYTADGYGSFFSTFESIPLYPKDSKYINIYKIKS